MALTGADVRDAIAALRRDGRALPVAFRSWQPEALRFALVESAWQALAEGELEARAFQAWEECSGLAGERRSREEVGRDLGVSASRVDQLRAGVDEAVAARLTRSALPARSVRLHPELALATLHADLSVAGADEATAEAFRRLRVEHAGWSPVAPSPDASAAARSARHRRATELRSRLDQIRSRPLPPVLPGRMRRRIDGVLSALASVALPEGTSPLAPDDPRLGALLELSRRRVSADPAREAEAWLALAPAWVAIGHIGLVWVHRRVCHVAGDTSRAAALVGGYAVSVLRRHGYLDAAHHLGMVAIHRLRSFDGGRDDQRYLFAHLVDGMGSMPFKDPHRDAHNIDERIAHATLLRRLAEAHGDEPVGRFAALARRRIFQLLHVKQVVEPGEAAALQASLESELRELDGVEHRGGFGPPALSWRLTRASVLLGWGRHEEAWHAMRELVAATSNEATPPVLARDVIELADRVAAVSGQPVELPDRVHASARVLDSWPPLAVRG